MSRKASEAPEVEATAVDDRTGFDKLLEDLASLVHAALVDQDLADVIEHLGVVGVLGIERPGKGKPLCSNERARLRYIVGQDST